MKDRNSESPDSTLKVNYVVDFGKGITDRRIKLNPILSDEEWNNIDEVIDGIISNG